VTILSRTANASVFRPNGDTLRRHVAADALIPHLNNFRRLLDK